MTPARKETCGVGTNAVLPFLRFDQLLRKGSGGRLQNAGNTQSWRLLGEVMEVCVLKTHPWEAYVSTHEPCTSILYVHP